MKDYAAYIDALNEELRRPTKPTEFGAPPAAGGWNKKEHKDDENTFPVSKEMKEVMKVFKGWWSRIRLLLTTTDLTENSFKRVGDFAGKKYF